MDMTEAENPERKYNVLVFGLERKNLPIPLEPMRKRNFSVFFERYGTARRFQEYDGVVVFQGIFEKFDLKTSYTGSYLSHVYDADELDKRKKEAALLVREGGFLCFLMTEPFIDSDQGISFRDTDLTKCHLNYSNFYRENFKNRIAHVTSVQDEFKRFLEQFGAASSYFKSHNNLLDLRVLAKVQTAPVGILINRTEYFLPSLLPDPRPDVITEYFEKLVDAITSTHNKLHQSVPEWVDVFKFTEESLLLNERTDILNRISRIDQRHEQLIKFKTSLVQTGPELVTTVSDILNITLGMEVAMVEEFREDIKLIGNDGKVACVCEVKGINKGVTRESINQTDSHRERSGFPAGFPALFIANTNIKSARSITEKEQEIATEQVKHAVHMRVLVMRTIDLLGLLRLVLAGELTTEKARSLVLSNIGWLKVESDSVHVLNGE